MLVSANSPGKRAVRRWFADGMMQQRAGLIDGVAEQLRATSAEIRVPMLIVRTAVESVAKAVEENDPDLMAHWSRMVRSSFDSATVSAVIAATCDLVSGLASDCEVDAGALMLFVEVTKARASEALLPAATIDRGRGAMESALRLLQTRDETTYVHSRATGVWCRRLCEALGLSADVTERIVRGGMLHDIGKIATPSAILTKPAALDDDEWTVMREHPDCGADVLLEIPSLAEYAPVVRCHHERPDGKGYPDGLTGEALTLDARVVSVADAFHSMVSERPYRSALTFGEAMALLRDGRGTQWDAAVVDAMVTAAGRVRSRVRDADLALLDPAIAVADAMGGLHSESLAG